jgi:hypothetical protein
MALLDRFANPLWHKVSKLDSQRQRVFAVVVTSYDFCRRTVEHELVLENEPAIRQWIPAHTPLTAELRTELTDEALLGLLRCCTCPERDGTGKLPAGVVQGLPEVWGTFVLADVNFRLKRSSPNVLSDTHYSTNKDEARTQVLTSWMKMLGIASPSFVTDINARGFGLKWQELGDSFVGGMLKSFLRTPDDVILSKARRVAAEIPLYRRRMTEYFIDRLATSDMLAPTTHHIQRNPKR